MEQNNQLKELVNPKFTSNIDVRNVANSLLLPSNTHIASLALDENTTISIVTQGDTDVYFPATDQNYTDPHSYPQALVDAIENGRIDEYECNDANWFGFIGVEGAKYIEARCENATPQQIYSELAKVAEKMGYNIPLSLNEFEDIGRVFVSYAPYKELVNPSFEQYVDMKDVNNSLLLESDTQIATLTLDDNNAIDIYVKGEISVYYPTTGETYYEPSEFPKELVDAIKNGENDKYSANLNNWFEALGVQNDKLTDLGLADTIVDCENCTPKQIYGELADIAESLGYNVPATLDEFKKVGDVNLPFDDKQNTRANKSIEERG